MAAPAAVLSILVKANTGQATTALLKTNQQLDATEKRGTKASGVFAGLAKEGNKAAAAARGLAGNLAKVGVVGVGVGFAYSVKKAADFEAQLSSLGAVADASAKHMERFREQALKAGADTKFSALEAAEAQTELAKGGLAVRTILKGGLTGALSLAAAGEMELADAASTTANALNLFKLRGKDAGHIADVLATAANKTTGDVKDFAIALTQGGAAAKAVGYDVDQTVAFLEALASAGVKGSDAGTSMKTALVHLANPVNKTQELMNKLGLKFFDANGEILGLAEMSEHLRDRLSGMTREQKLATIAQIAGTDGMRGLLAIMDAGPGKLNAYEKGLSKQGTAAETAAKKQDNLKGSVEQLSGSVETLGIQVGTMLIPAFRRGADELTDFANKVGKIVARDDLSIGEKLQRSLDLAKVTVDPWIEKLAAAIERLNIPKRLADAISAATPVIVAAAAKAAGAGAVAFVRAFGEANVWGKLVIGGWLLSKMGGLKAFTALGVKSGKAMGTGMAAGAAMTGPASAGGAAKGAAVSAGAGAAGAVAGGASGTFAKSAAGAAAGAAAAAQARAANLTAAARGVAPALLALKVASDFMKDKSDLGLLDQYAGTIERVAKAGDAAGMQKLAGQMRETAQANNDLTKGKHLNMFADALDAAASKGGSDLSQLREAFARMARSSGGDLERLRGDFAKLGATAPATVEKIRAVTQDVRRLFRHMAGGAKPDMEHITNAVRINSQRIKESLGKNTREGKDALQLNIDLAVKAIRRGMKNGSVAADEGMSEIRRLFVKSLALYGLSPEHARGRDPVSGQLKIPKKDRGSRQFQRGGPIDVGAPSGDSVPAMLERGEYVVNRRAVRKVGRKALDRLNFGAAPRFQEGGIVELLHPFNDPEGHGGSNSHLHIAAASVQAIVALGKRLQKLGWLVSEHPAFGGVNARHAAGGYHYTG
ncbi:MAG TPA: phage tail tape measure protein, partial [Vicinamibacterales bacterium]|nr:phage tail tape measure protein [Vicinamibacterales bacterium]